MAKTILLWDFDGTLAYRDGMWTASVCAILESNGYSAYDKEVISDTMRLYYPWRKHELAHKDYFDGLSWWEYIQQKVVGSALFAIGIKGDENVRLAKQFRDEYIRLNAWYLFDDSIQALEMAKSKGYDCAILSNHTPELYELTNYLKITKYFKYIVTSADIGYEKPHRKFYDVIKTFERYDRYIMIGDNYTADIMGALEFGLDAIMVRKPNEMGYKKYSKDLVGIWEHIEKYSD